MADSVIMKYCPAALLMFPSGCKNTNFVCYRPRQMSHQQTFNRFFSGITNGAVKVIVPIDRDRVVQPYLKASPATYFLLPFVHPFIISPVLLCAAKCREMGI